MNRTDDELTHVFAHDMAHAERGRNRLLVLGVVLVVAGVLVVTAALVFGTLRQARDEASATTASVASKAARGRDVADAQPGSRAREQAAPSAAVGPSKASSASTQKVKIAIGEVGYEPAVVTVKKDAPVELTVAQGEGCAAGFLMPALGVQADNSSGPATVRLGSLSPGTYRFTCSMEMVEGRLVVE